ncbi:zf-CCHC domain-containing protein/zf-CCHC_4 domain-containing protein [Cephalotus follicularis]|uniref:Zf-CCHC domain-containing protein/zf-CCHC_4 domain-containing protein n=1 Tax=Cephalotus follicularis TaxID=3775 RepID=A0A1Q3CXW7_CEPFO|nr:zf-CCHC domain-containing protein/zf-CCHC_4 domain-containing protein [Cephalotus follicularis]
MRTRPAPSEWQDGGSSTKSSKNSSQQTDAKGTPSQEDDIRPRACFYCDRAGHQVKVCWLKNKLCMRCGATGHVMKNCTGDPSQQTANCGTPDQGSNMGTGACYHYGRKGHLQKDCWRMNGLCLRCGASGHSVKDYPKSPATAPMGPMSNSDAATGPSQRGSKGKGKGIMRGTIFTLTCIILDHNAFNWLTIL